MNNRTFFANPSSLPLIAPSILSADFARLGAECHVVLDGGADLLHMDVMDGHFVPNLTMGPAVCRSLRRALPDAFLDVHLMVTNPQQMIDPFAEAGANHVTFHIEADGDARELIEQIHSRGMSAGISLRPDTEAEAVAAVVAHVDLVLLMTVHPGFSGQKFIEAMLPKARTLRSMLRDDQRLQVDGGVNPQTAAQCREAGCDVLVAASAIFGTDHYDSSMAVLRGTSRVPSRG